MLFVTALTVVAIALSCTEGAPAYENGATVDTTPVGDYSQIYIAPANENGLEEAVLETESFPSSIQSFFENHANKVSDFFDTKPIIDTIQEHEKYGNNGDQFYSIGKVVVDGVEAFSNFINKLITAQNEAKKSISANITKQLNLLGGKLVGLA